MFFRKSTIFLLFFVFLDFTVTSQELLSHTFSNFGFEYKKNVQFLGTIGETFTGTKYLKKYVIIEGIYAYNNFKLDTISPEYSNCKIFPNPANQKFVIQNESNNFSIKIDVFTLSGMKLRTYEVSANSIVNVSDLMSGIYILKVYEHKEAKIRQRIFKQIIIN